jgi:hypothetical protein
MKERLILYSTDSTPLPSRVGLGIFNYLVAMCLLVDSLDHMQYKAQVKE